MDRSEELDQFHALEEKLDTLIGYIQTLKKEKDALAEKTHIQEEKITDLSGEIEVLRSGRDQARQKIISLLEKIEQVDM